MKLTTEDRNNLPSNEFALPAQRKYPVNDKVHAQLAKGRATQMYNKGKITAGQLTAIHAKANRVIGHTYHSFPKVK